MSSGPARLGCALIVLASSCNPFSFGEHGQYGLVGDGAVAFDDTIIIGPADTMVEGPTDTAVEGPTDVPMVPEDAMADAMPDADVPDAMGVPDAAMPDAMIDAGVPDAAMPPDAPPDASVPPDGSVPPDDGGPGDGSLSDALPVDAREPPDLPVGGANGENIKSFYACSTGEGASALPLLLAILALRRRRR